MEKLLIYGAGGFAREVAWLAGNLREDLPYELVAFIDDSPKRWDEKLNGTPVISLETAREKYADGKIAVAMGSPQIREQIVEKCKKMGFSFATLIHKRAEISEWIEFGSGVVLCFGSMLTTNIKVGNYVQINGICTIGHDVVIGDFTTFAPGVHVSGWVRFGRSVYVGTGAVVLNGTEDAPIVIGDNAVIGAAACVTKSVPAGATMVGVPAKPLER